MKALATLRKSTANAAAAAQTIIDGIDEIRGKIRETADALDDLKSRPAGPRDCAIRAGEVVAELQRQARSNAIFYRLADPGPTFDSNDVVRSLNGDEGRGGLDVAMMAGLMTTAGIAIPHLPATDFGGANGLSAAQLFAIVDPERLTSVLVKETLEATADFGVAAIESSDLLGLITKAQSELDRLEVEEEMTIRSIEDAGLPVYRRGNARPEIVLAPTTELEAALAEQTGV